MSRVGGACVCVPHHEASGRDVRRPLYWFLVETRVSEWFAILPAGAL